MSYSGELKQDVQSSGSYSAQRGHPHNHLKSVDSAVESVRAPNIAQRVREEFKAIQQSLHEQHSSHQLRKQGGSENMHEKKHSSSSPQFGKRGVSENMDVSDVKAPDMFQRIKEEVEAVGETLHGKDSKAHCTTQEYDHEDTNPGCWTGMGKTLERICGGKKA